MNNVNGILLGIASMAAFSLEDLFVKKLSETLPLGQILLTLGFFGAVIFALMVRREGNRVWAVNWHAKLTHLFC